MRENKSMNAEMITEEKVFSFIEEHHMFTAGDKVVVGVSGGADSVCLLFVLLKYASKMPIDLWVLHVNHGIREEAYLDAEYVKRLCEEQHIPFRLVNADVKGRVKREKCSEEEAGRKCRYEAFYELAKEVGANKIAVAHNSNDRAETMLFHLFRGSGLKGLTGIAPVRDMIVRPILCLERNEIEVYLKSRNISFCTDATNAEDDYTRNRIRHYILPFAQEEIASGSVSHMANTADQLLQVEDFLEQQTNTMRELCVKKLGCESTKSLCDKGVRIEISQFLRAHSVIQSRLLHKELLRLSPHHKDITSTHVKDLLTLFTLETGRQIQLPFGILGRREYEYVILEKMEEALEVEKNAFQEIVLTKELLQQGKKSFAYGADKRITFCLAEYIKGTEVPRNEYTKWFDYGKIRESFILRKRSVGDYFTISGGNKELRHKSLKDYMITEKIPRTKRDELILLAEDNHVIWLPGYRISEYYKVSDETKQLLVVEITEETEDKNTCQKQ